MAYINGKKILFAIKPVEVSGPSTPTDNTVSVTEGDEGKILQLVDGKYTLVSVPTAEGESF